MTCCAVGAAEVVDASLLRELAELHPELVTSIAASMHKDEHRFIAPPLSCSTAFQVSLAKWSLANATPISEAPLGVKRRFGLLWCW